MTFFLPEYLLFLLATSIVYYSAGEQVRMYVLFAASLFCLGVLSIPSAVIAFVFTVINYLAGLLLGGYGEKPVLKSRYFWLIVCVDVCILSLFKYSAGITQNHQPFFSALAVSWQQPYSAILIPLGLSYYTFQSLGYLIRIDRGSEKPERDFAVFAVYLLFFPKILAGPVERSNHFFPQVKKLPGFAAKPVLEGVRLFVWGLFKKTVIADQLAGPLFEVYDHVHTYNGPSLLLVLLFQTIYIYADFSGYTDMALGSAKIFGIDLIDNFKRPFLAKTVAEYWKRWHISLSSWCNDFIYNPFIVKYRKWGNMAMYAGLFLTFLIMGIWHGSNINFVILGLLQASAILYETRTKAFRIQLAARFSPVWVNTISRILVFLFMSFSMVFFFAGALPDALYFISHLFSPVRPGQDAFAFIDDKIHFVFALLVFALLFLLEIVTEKGKQPLLFFQRQPAWIHTIVYTTCLLLIYYFRPVVSSFYYSRF